MPSRVRPDDLVRILRSGESARPRLIWYSPGERIELSGRVLATWVAKAADMLQEELDAGVGDTVRLAGAPHWRLLVWAMAGWTVGARVSVCERGSTATVFVTDAHRLVEAPDAVDADVTVALTLPALARRSPVDLPAGVVDEAAVLSSYADVMEPYDVADDGDIALVTESGEQISYADVVGPGEADRIHVSGGRPLSDVLRVACASWAAGGSIVLTDPAWEAEKGGDPAGGSFADVLASEGVSARRD